MKLFVATTDAQAAHLAKEMLHIHGGWLGRQGAAARGHDRQGFLFHDSSIGALQRQLAPLGLVVEGCQGWPCPPITL